MRSPPGNIADSMGLRALISCSVYVAIALARDLHCCSVSSGAASRRHSGPFSRNTSPGRLSTTSVTPSSAKYPHSGRINSRTMVSRSSAAMRPVSARVETIDRSKVEISGDKNRCAVTLILVERRLDTDRALEHEIGHIVARLRGILQDRVGASVPVAGLGCLVAHSVLHQSQQGGGSEPLPPMIVDSARKPR